MHPGIHIRSGVILWMMLPLLKALKDRAGSASLPYPIYLPLWDATNASVEVQMLLSSKQIIECINLGTVADVNSLVPALHDVYQPPEKQQQQQQQQKTKRLFEMASRNIRGNVFQAVTYLVWHYDITREHFKYDLYFTKKLCKQYSVIHIPITLHIKFRCKW